MNAYIKSDFLDERWSPSRVHSETLGRSVRKMSYRSDRHIRTYTASEFFQLVNGSDIMLNVGGLDINAQDLAIAGWSCRIVYNIYGGRTKVVFKSQDGRSSMVFRVDRTREEMYAYRLGTIEASRNDFALLKRVGNGTLNIIPKVLVHEKVVQKQVEVVKEVITEEATDLELLTRVNDNIKKRLAGRPKPKTPKPTQSMVA